MNNYYAIVACPICEDQIETDNEEAIMQIETCGCNNCLEALDPFNIPDDTRVQMSGLDNGIS